MPPWHTRTVQFDSTSIAAYSFLSGYYRTSNKLDSAIWAYHNLLRLLPDNVQIYNDLSRLQVQRGNLDTALVTFGMSVEIQSDTTNAPAVVGLAEIYEMKDRLDSATAVLERAVGLSPEYIPYRQSLINLYARMDSILGRFTCPRDCLKFRRRICGPTLGILYFSLDSVEQSVPYSAHASKQAKLCP